MKMTDIHTLHVPRVSRGDRQESEREEFSLLAPSSIPSVAELPVIKRIPSFVRPGGNFADVGAHVGFYTVALSHYFDYVDAYEPSRLQFGLLSTNLQENRLANCRAVPKALGATIETREIIVTGRSGGTNTFSRLDSTARPMDSYSVEVVSLDAIGYSDLSFLKIDVEGWELEVLRGASETLRSCSPSILVEVWEVESQRRDVGNFLAAHDYSFNFIFDDFPELALCTPQSAS